MIEKVLEVKNLQKNYKDVKAVDDISFYINRGEIVAILGPNGAGKTTTLEIIEGLRSKDEGEIYYFGKKIEKVDSKIKERIGVQLQESHFFENLKVSEIIKTFSGLYQKSVDMEKLISDFSLEDKRNSKISKLSGGQLQRLAIATAIINDPELVFLDEPTTGLDPQARRNSWEIISKLRKSGKTIILTTHYMEEAEFLADRIYIFDQGRIIAEGKLKELIHSLQMNSIITFQINSNGKSEDIKEDFVNSLYFKITANEGSYTIETKDVESVLIKLFEESKTKGFDISNMVIRKPNLEDVFLHLTGKSLRD